MPSWMHTKIEAVIDDSGAICAKVVSMRRGKGGKPGPGDTVRWADPQVYHAVRCRYPGSYSLWGSMGMATAFLVDFDSLETLQLTGLERLREVYGSWGGRVLIEIVRDTMAPGGLELRNVFEPCGGAAESDDLLLCRALESIELGVYHPTRGWAGFDTSSPECNVALAKEQQRVWRLADSKLPQGFNAKIKHLTIGADRLSTGWEDGLPGVFSVGPVNDMMFTSICELDLGNHSGFRLRDLELAADDSKVLDRKVVGVVTRFEKSPLLLEFDRRGGLDPSGLHIPLEGVGIRLASFQARAVLGSYGLDWLRADTNNDSR